MSALALGIALATGGAALRSVVAGARTAADARDRGVAAAAAGQGGSRAAERRAGRGARTARAPHAAGALAPAAADAAGGTRRAPPAAPPLAAPITLDVPRALGVALTLAGRDPDAPRALDLWRVEADGRAARIARGHSASDGTLVFAPLLLPARPIELVAAPRGAGPRAAGASAPVVARRDPAAPRVAATAQGEDLVLRVAAAESGGAIVVERAGAAIVLAHAPVETDADAAPAPVEIALAGARGDALQVVQIDPDGRRSPPRPVLVNAGNHPEQE